MGDYNQGGSDRWRRELKYLTNLWILQSREKIYISWEFDDKTYRVRLLEMQRVQQVKKWKSYNKASRGFLK